MSSALLVKPLKKQVDTWSLVERPKHRDPSADVKQVRPAYATSSRMDSGENRSAEACQRWYWERSTWTGVRISSNQGQS